MSRTGNCTSRLQRTPQPTTPATFVFTMALSKPYEAYLLLAKVVSLLVGMKLVLKQRSCSTPLFYLESRRETKYGPRAAHYLPRLISPKLKP